jgi:predicted MFS family arabinose efflux permease
MAAGSLAATVGVLPAYLIGGLAVQLRDEFAFGSEQLGLIVALFFLVSSLSSAPFGRLVERLGSYRTMVAGGLTAAVGLGALGAAWSWVALAGLVTVAGLANGMLQVSSNLLIVRGVRGRRRGLAFGVKLAAIPLSTLLAGAAVPLVALTVGWRWAFAGAALLALTTIPLTPAFDPGTRTGGGGSTPRPSSPVGALVLIAVGGGVGTAAANCLGAFLVDWSVVAGADPGWAGTLLAGASVVGIATRLATGAAADRWSWPAMPWVAGMLIAGTAGFVAIASGPGGWGFIGGVVLAFAAGWGWNGLYNLAVVRANEDAPAGATGITQTGVYMGSTVGPLAFGLIAGRISYPTAWLTAAVAAGLAGVLLVVGDRWMRGRWFVRGAGQSDTVERAQ